MLGSHLRLFLASLGIHIFLHFSFPNRTSSNKNGTKTQTLEHFKGLYPRSNPNPGASQSISLKVECFSETHSKSIHQSPETPTAGNKSSLLCVLVCSQRCPDATRTHHCAFTAMTHWIHPALGLATQSSKRFRCSQKLQAQVKQKVFLTTLVTLVFSTFMALGLSYYKVL